MTSEMQEFLRIYGSSGLRLIVEEFIVRAPSFPGDLTLAREIGSAVGLLEVALEKEQQ